MKKKNDKIERNYKNINYRITQIILFIFLIPFIFIEKKSNNNNNIKHIILTAST